MRFQIIAWSIISGLVAGLILDLLIAGVIAVMGAIAPLGTAGLRSHPIVIGLLLVIPIVGALLGYLEGRLKA
jgi:hypothetical protein